MADNVHTVKELQEALLAKGFDPGEIDGQFGAKTSEALKAYQASNPTLSATGQADEPTLKALFPSPTISAPRTLKAGIINYILNGVKSKINAVAVLMVGTLTAWVYTKFGLDIPAEVKDTITVALTAGFGLIIAWLRTFFLSPHVTTKQPAVVKKPAEVK